MIVDLQVSDKKIILEIHQASIIREIDNIVSFDSKTQNLVSTGTNQEEFQKNYPKKYKKYRNRLVFSPIFDVQSFNPEAVGLFLGRWINPVVSHVAGNIIFRSQAKLELNISFDGYESIS